MLRRSFCLIFAWQLAACSDGKDEPAAETSKDASPQTAAPTSDASTRPSNTPQRDAGSTPAPPPRPTRDAGTPSRDPRDAAAPSGGGNMASGGTGGAQTPEPTTPPANTCVGGMKLDVFVSDPKLCVYVFAQNLSRARQLAFAPNGDLFVNNGSLVAVWDANKDGSSDSNERSTFAQAQGLNHGAAFSRDNKFVYASSATTVFRWPYSSGQRMAQGAAQVVVSGIPGGGHNTRALQFDSQGRLIVGVGSAGNVDTAQSDLDNRSQIRRFTIPESLPNGGLPYGMGEVLATGMRNEAGIFVDADDRIWGVENGRDNLNDSDMGGDIHNDNPGEEINLVDGQGTKYYGYPHCYTEFRLTGGRGQGAQWADQTLAAALRKTDDFCTNPAEVRPPAYALPAHWAPLGVIRYTGRVLPWRGDLIIGAHGSWNRNPASGRLVARAKFEGDKITGHEVLVGEKDSSGQLREGGWNVRPVDVRQGPDEAVYVSDDQGGRILKIGYEQ